MPLAGTGESAGAIAGLAAKIEHVYFPQMLRIRLSATAVYTTVLVIER